MDTSPGRDGWALLLMSYCVKGNLAGVAEILAKCQDAGSDDEFTCVVDELGNTPLHLATMAGADDIAQLLIERTTIRLDCRNKDTAPFPFVADGAESPADSTMHDNGVTALHYAISRGLVGTTKLLLRRMSVHSVVEARYGPTKETLLHHAARHEGAMPAIPPYGIAWLARDLIALGSDPLARSTAGLTPYDILRGHCPPSPSVLLVGNYLLNRATCDEGEIDAITQRLGPAGLRGPFAALRSFEDASITAFNGDASGSHAIALPHLPFAVRALLNGKWLSAGLEMVEEEIAATFGARNP